MAGADPVNRRLAVTGTDTDVGKTVVTACLAASARAAGRRVLACKPVASGVSEGSIADDAALIAAGGGHAPAIHTSLVAPLSPHRAAALASRAIDVPAVRAWLAERVGDPLLIEGVGGWRVPLGPGAAPAELRDLIRGAVDGVIVVAADRLGTLNATRLTVDAVRADGFAITGVVLSRSPSTPDASTPYNLDDLRSLIDVPVAPLPPLDVADPRARAYAGAALWIALGFPEFAAPG